MADAKENLRCRTGDTLAGRVPRTRTERKIRFARLFEQGARVWAAADCAPSAPPRAGFFCFPKTQLDYARLSAGLPAGQPKPRRELNSATSAACDPSLFRLH